MSLISAFLKLQLFRLRVTWPLAPKEPHISFIVPHRGHLICAAIFPFTFGLARSFLHLAHLNCDVEISFSSLSKSSRLETGSKRTSSMNLTLSAFLAAINIYGSSGNRSLLKLRIGFPEARNFYEGIEIAPLSPFESSQSKKNARIKLIDLFNF